MQHTAELLPLMIIIGTLIALSCCKNSMQRSAGEFQVRAHQLFNIRGPVWTHFKV